MSARVVRGLAVLLAALLVYVGPSLLPPAAARQEGGAGPSAKDVVPSAPTGDPRGTYARLRYEALRDPFFGSGVEGARDAFLEPTWERISLWRTGCYGTCPVYRIDLYPDGRARWTGEAHVERLGVHESTLRTAEYALLELLAEHFGLAEMEEAYSADWTDDETIFVQLESAGNTLTIEDYGRRGPPELRAFQLAIDGLAGQLHWTAAEAAPGDR